MIAGSNFGRFCFVLMVYIDADGSRQDLTYTDHEVFSPSYSSSFIYIRKRGRACFSSLCEYLVQQLDIYWIIRSKREGTSSHEGTLPRAHLTRIWAIAIYFVLCILRLRVHVVRRKSQKDSHTCLVAIC